MLIIIAPIDIEWGKVQKCEYNIKFKKFKFLKKIMQKLS